MGSDVVFAQVLHGLLTERYRRNRAELARAAHVSPSALSQYVRGRATPSLEVLVHLAEALDVSLDYLVFGRERSAPVPEVRYLTSHIEAGLRDAQTHAAALHDLVARTGARLGEAIRITVEELLSEATGLGGMLSAEDATVLEGCSVHSTIVTTTLDMEVLVLTDDEAVEAAAPSLFAEVVASNISEGSRYDYFIPEGRELGRAAELLIREVSRLCDIGVEQVQQQLRVFQVTSSCVPGFTLHRISLDRLRNRASAIHDRVAPFLHSEPGEDGEGYVATLEPASRSYQYFALLEPAKVARLLLEVKARDGQAPAVVANAGSGAGERFVTVVP
jgi:transcriptional regulator with XRE-family HTH domain